MSDRPLLKRIIIIALCVILVAVTVLVLVKVLNHRETTTVDGDENSPYPYTFAVDGKSVTLTVTGLPGSYRWESSEGDSVSVKRTDSAKGDTCQSVFLIKNTDKDAQLAEGLTFILYDQGSIFSSPIWALYVYIDRDEEGNLTYGGSSYTEITETAEGNGAGHNYVILRNPVTGNYHVIVMGDDGMNRTAITEPLMGVTVARRYYSDELPSLLATTVTADEEEKEDYSKELSVATKKPENEKSEIELDAKNETETTAEDVYEWVIMPNLMCDTTVSLYSPVDDSTLTLTFSSSATETVTPDEENGENVAENGADTETAVQNSFRLTNHEMKEQKMNATTYTAGEYEFMNLFGTIDVTLPTGAEELAFSTAGVLLESGDHATVGSISYVRNGSSFTVLLVPIGTVDAASLTEEVAREIYGDPVTESDGITVHKTEDGAVAVFVTKDGYVAILQSADVNIAFTEAQMLATTFALQ